MYQEIKGVKYYFNEREVIADVVEKILKEKEIEYDRYFKYIDNKNCDRLYNRILKDVYNG